MKMVKSERSSPSSKTLRSKSGSGRDATALSSARWASFAALGTTAEVARSLASALSSPSSVGDASSAKYMSGAATSLKGAAGSLAGVEGGGLGGEVMRVSRAGVGGGAWMPVRGGAAEGAGAAVVVVPCCCCFSRGCCCPERSTPRATETACGRGWLDVAPLSRVGTHTR